MKTLTPRSIQPRLKHTRPSGNSSAFRICAVPFAALFAVSATAANISWNGATDAVWSTGGDWVGGIAPLAGDVAVFDSGSVSNLSTTLGVDRAILGLRITTPGGLITIGAGNLLTLGAGGIDMSAASQNLLIEALVALAADQSWNVANGRTLTANGIISGTNVNLNKIGLGDLILGGANTYTGITTIGGGTLTLNGSLNGTTGTDLTFAGTGIFNVSAASGVSQGMGALKFSGGDGVVKSTNNGAPSTVTFASRGPRATGATGNFVLAGGTAGTPGVPGTNNIAITGALTGQLMDRGLFFNGSSYAAYDNAGFVRELIYGTDANAPASIPAGATLGVDDPSKNVQISGDITAQTTAAVNTISEPGSFSITLAGGQTLSFNGLLKSGGNAATISGGAGIQTTAPGSEMVIRTDAPGDTLTISTPILANGASSLTKSGTGTLIYSVDNAYTGGTAINAGVLQVGTGGTTGSLGVGDVNNRASLVFNRSDAFTVANVISGSGSLTKSGGGTLTLSAANTYTGATIVGTGTLTLSNVAALSGTSGISQSSGTRIIVNVPSFSLAKLNPVNGGGGVVAGSFLRFTGGAANQVQTAGAANGPGIIFGTLEMDTQNFSTDWEISLGEGSKITAVQGLVAQAITANGGIKLYGNATFEANNTNGTGTATAGERMTVDIGDISAGSAGLKTLTFTGAENKDASNGVNPSGIKSSSKITDGAVGRIAIAKSGTGTIGIQTASTYSGGTTVNDGVLKAMNATALGTATGGFVNFGAGSTGRVQLNSSAASQTWIGLNSDATTPGTPVVESFSGNNTLTINNPVANTYAGALRNDAGLSSANMALAKGGAGTLTLTGIRTYTFGTTVNGGTLLWSGAVNLPTPSNSVPATVVALTVGAAGNFSMADGTARNITASVASLGTTAVALTSGATLTFDWNGSQVDNLAATVVAFKPAATTVGISINPTNNPSGSGLALLTGIAGSTLNTPNYFLANNTNYTATLTKSATSLSIGSYASATALTSAYWLGGQVPSALGAMGLSRSDGTLASNWAVAATDTTGTANGLVPGAGTDVFFSTNSSATQQSSVILGADMSVKSLTFNDSTQVTISGTANGATLGTGGNYLTIGSGGITVNASSAATTTIGANVFIGATQMWNVASGKQLTVSGALAGANSNLQLASANSLTIAGGGTVLLSGGTNIYSGEITVDNGTSGTLLKMGSAGAFGAGTGSALNVSSVIVKGTGAAVDLNGQALNANAEAFSGILTLNGTGIGGGGALTNSSASAASYQGLVKLGSASTIVGGVGANTAALVSLLSTGTITGAGFGLTLDGVAGNTTGTGSRIDSVISTGTGSLTKDGTGTWILTGSNTYTGATTINNGSLQIGRGLATGALSPASSITINNSANLIFRRSNTLTQGVDFNSVISGTGNVIQLGGGTLLLNGVNTYSGNTTVASTGTLSLGGSRAIGTGTLIMSTANGKLDSAVPNLVNLNNNLQSWNADFTFTGTNSLNLGNGAVSLGTAAGTSRTITITANTLTVGGAISNGTTANSITKAGAGTLTLGGNSNYTGATILSAGTVSVGVDANLGNANGLIFNGGTLQITGTSLTSYAAGVIGSHPVTLTAEKTIGFDIANAANTFTVSQNLNQGSGGLTKSGVGQLVLGGANTFTGPTKLSGGVLSVSADANLGNANALILDGGTLQITGTALASYSGGFIGTHPVTVTTDKTISFDIADSGNNFVVGDSLSQGTGGLVKLGAGTLTLAAGNAYTGATMVNAGTLVLQNGSISGTTTVGSNATLSGDNSTFENVTVNPGGIFSPGGGGIGSLTVTGNLVLDSTPTTSSHLAIQFNSDAFAVDTIAVSGNLNIASGVVLDVRDLGFNPSALYDNPAPVISYGGIWDGGTFMGLPDDSYFLSEGIAYLISYNGNGGENVVTLAIVANVPEPGAAVSLLGGLGLLLGVRRRRV